MNHKFLKCITAFLVTCTVTIGSASATDLTDKIIILDPGHGLGHNTYEGYDEGEYMLDLAYEIKPLLEAQGATVYLTRMGDESTLLGYRVGLVYWLTLEAYMDTRLEALPTASDTEKIQLIAELEEAEYLMNVADRMMSDTLEYRSIYTNTPYDSSEDAQIHPDTARIFAIQAEEEIANQFLFISLHSNATGKPINTSKNGVDAFYMGSTAHPEYYDTYTATEKNIQFSNLILDNLNKIGLASNEVQEELFYVNREMNIPSVLMENGFHTNIYDRELLQSEGFLQQMANAYTDSIVEYFSMNSATNEMIETNEFN